MRDGRIKQEEYSEEGQRAEGIFRHESGRWAIRFTCGHGHVHEQAVGRYKSEAVDLHHTRRNRARSEPTWCPRIEREQAEERLRAHEALELSRITFRAYAEQYLDWAKEHHRSYATTQGQVQALVEAFGDDKLDEIRTDAIEAFLSALRDGKSPSARRLSVATVNRYRDRLSGMFKRAIRRKLLRSNPVQGIEKYKEPAGRIVYLDAEGEDAVRAELPEALRSLFTFSVHTGLRWSEQVSLRWRDIDLHAGVVTVPRSKNGEQRHVPLNSLVRSLLFDLSLQRKRPDDASEAVFACRHAQADKFFPKAVACAKEALRNGHRDASRLDGYTWHGNRHTFTSRLVMGGVDLRTVQELGGWKSLKMVLRYAHLAPAHLHAAVERLVPQPASQLGRNLDAGATHQQDVTVTT